MQSHRLRCAKVIRVPENGKAGELSADVATHMTPAPARAIAFHAIRFGFRGEERRILLTVPVPMAAHAKTAVMILRQLQWTRAGALLGGSKFKEMKRFFPVREPIEPHFPDF